MPVRNHPFSKRPSRRLERARCLGALGFLLLASVSAVHGGQSAAAAPATGPSEGLSPDSAPAPDKPSAVLEIVEIHPFKLTTGYSHDWMANRPLVTSGLLVVLKVDPAYVVPRNTAESILFVGEGTVQRLNHGHRSGYVVGLVPGEPDLSAALLWFGRPGQPGRVTPEMVAAERGLAERAGIKTFRPEQVASALGEAVEVGDLSDLLRGLAADLVLEYSPDEKSLAETWRLPTVGPDSPR